MTLGINAYVDLVADALVRSHDAGDCTHDEDGDAQCPTCDARYVVAALCETTGALPDAMPAEWTAADVVARIRLMVDNDAAIEPKLARYLSLTADQLDYELRTFAPVEPS